MTYVSEELFEESLKWLMSNEALFVSRRHRSDRSSVLSLVRRRVIRGWKYPESSDTGASEVGGELNECYGSTQRLGTALTFQSLNEYQWVKAQAKRHLDIRMHDRNVQPRGLL